MHAYVRSSIVYNAAMNIADKKAVYLHNGILYSCKKKKELLPFVTAWKDMEIIMLSEISQSEKDKNTILFHLYVESNEQNKLTNKIGTEAWTHGTDSQLSEEREKGGLDGRR